MSSEIMSSEVYGDKQNNGADFNTSYTVNRAFRLIIPPTVFAALIMALLDMADVLIITRIYGTDGLLIASVFMPVIYLSYSVFNGIGYGGSILFAHHIGKKDYEGAQNIFAGTVFIVLVIAAAAMAAGLGLFDIIADLLLGEKIAGDPACAAMVAEFRAYGAWFILGLPLAAVKLTLTYFVRADNNPCLAMYAHLLQAAVNIAGDIIFMGVFDCGPRGAAMSLSLSMAAALGLLLFHFRARFVSFTFRIAAPCREKLVRIMLFSVNSICDSFYNPLLMMILNGLVLRSFGADEASIFFMVVYCYFFVDVITDGMKESSAPLQGIFYGEGDNRSVIAVSIRAVGIGAAAGAGLAAILLLYPALVAALYGFDCPPLMEKCYFAVRLFALSIPFGIINSLMANSYQAVGNSLNAFAITFLRGFAVPLAAGGLALLIKSELLFRSMFIITELSVLAVWLGFAFYAKNRSDKESLLLLPKSAPEHNVCFYSLLSSDTKELPFYQKNLSDFLENSGAGLKKSEYAALALEEIVLYARGRAGFKSSNFIDLRAIIQKDGLVRFIVKFEAESEELMAAIRVPGEAGDEYLGMRLLYKISRRFDYAYIMRFNCIDIVF